MVTRVPGNQQRAIYLDAIEEALGKPYDRAEKRKLIRPRRRVNDVAIRQLKLVEKQQRILAKTLRPPRGEPCELCHRRPEITPTEMPPLVAASSEITNQIAKISQSIRDGYKAEREAMGRLSEDDLSRVMKTELLRIAKELEDEDWQLILAQRFGEDVAAVVMGQR